MAKDVRFSVSMCVYGKDNPEWFRLSVDSILNQSAAPSEIVIVVDGPVPDELDAIIRSYESDSRFNIIRLETNQGHGNARRIGLDACTNELVALMDADDISVSSRFEQQLRLFEDESVDIVGGDIAEFIDDTNNIIGKRLVPTNDADIKDYLKKRCPFNQVTVMFKKSAVDSAGGYIDWYCDEDYYLWIRMSQNGFVMRNTGTVLVNARVGSEMYSRRGGMKYFKSEARLQGYMLKNDIIGFGTYAANIIKRFIVQLMLPNKLRGYVFKKFARSEA